VRVLLPLPDRDFDVTEVAVPWADLAAPCLSRVKGAHYCGLLPARLGW